MSTKFLRHCESNIDVILDMKDSCYSLKELCSLLGYSEHGRNTGALSLFCSRNNIDISHFTSNGKAPVNSTIEKVCPNCGAKFTTKTGSKEKQTCSHLCANTFFKQAQKDEVLPEQYAYRAKRAGMVKCAICSETEVVDIHHIDEDRNNNDLDNLMPLCPTHHAYIHRGKFPLIEKKVLDYLDNRPIAG